MCYAQWKIFRFKRKVFRMNLKTFFRFQKMYFWKIQKSIDTHNIFLNFLKHFLEIYQPVFDNQWTFKVFTLRTKCFTSNQKISAIQKSKNRRFSMFLGSNVFSRDFIEKLFVKCSEKIQYSTKKRESPWKPNRNSASIPIRTTDRYYMKKQIYFNP